MSDIILQICCFLPPVSVPRRGTVRPVPVETLGSYSSHPEPGAGAGAGAGEGRLSGDRDPGDSRGGSAPDRVHPVVDDQGGLATCGAR